MEIKTPTATAEVVVGVLGIVSPAINRWGSKDDSDHWQGVEDKTFELHRRRQSKSTKSAKGHLKKLLGRQRHFRKDCDHVLTQHMARSVSSGALVFENRTSSRFTNTSIRGRAKMRKTQHRRLRGWSFAQFQTFVIYKEVSEPHPSAEARRVKVGLLDPRYTSPKCSQCRHIERGNRPSQAEYRCKKFGFECHADHNAAVNSRENFLKLRVSVNMSIVVCPEIGD